MEEIIKIILTGIIIIIAVAGLIYAYILLDR